MSLRESLITDRGLAHLKALPELEDLDLDATLITDAGLEHLRALRAGLQYIETIETLSNLEGLNTRRTKVTPEGLARLKQRLPGLK